MRFSLRGLLLSVPCFAVGCALLFSAPSYIAIPALLLLAVALPAALTAGVVYTRGAWRAFCIGGLFPSGLVLYLTGWFLAYSLVGGEFASVSDWHNLSNVISVPCRTYAAVSWIMTVLIGAMAVLIRYVALRQRS